MSTLIRQLPSSEWDKLQGLPFTTNGMPDPDRWQIVTAEDKAGDVVGLWAKTKIDFLEGLWVREDQRRRLVGSGLRSRMVQLLKDSNVVQCFTITQDPYVTNLAERSGFVKVPGDFMMYLVEGK